MTFQKLSAKRPYEEVVAQVREMLFQGTLKPGDRLPGERDLCVQLGIGRPALREALRALEATGLIVLRKGKMGGAFISNGKAQVIADNMSDLLRLSSISVDQLFEVRLWFQPEIARAACQRATKEVIERLKQNVEEGKRLHAQGLSHKRIEVNLEFHSILAEATNNPVAQVVLRGLTDALKALIKEVGSYPIASLFDDRRTLIDALSRRDEDAAAEAMKRILKSTKPVFKQLEERRLKVLNGRERGMLPLATKTRAVRLATKVPKRARRRKV